MYANKKSLEENISTVHSDFLQREGYGGMVVRFCSTPPPPKFVRIMIITEIKSFSIREGGK